MKAERASELNTAGFSDVLGELQSLQLMLLNASEEIARLRSASKLPSGWRIVPEHISERQILAGSKAINSADKYRRQVLSAPKLPGQA